MLTTIAIADACLSTAVAIVAIVKWRGAARFAKQRDQEATRQEGRAASLDAECERLSGFVTSLSARLDVQRSKPGPQKRAREKDAIRAKTAELIREIAA